MAKKSVSRYTIGSGELNGKPERYLTRNAQDLVSTTRNKLFLPRGFQIKSDELDSPDHPMNRIYLDGACQGPYIDANRNLFSFDHHGNCHRSITDAACVQVLKFSRDRIVKSVGFEVVGNHNDLDSVCASWEAMHADRIAYDDYFCDLVVPHMLVEGNIDSLGPSHEYMTGLNKSMITLVKGTLNKVQAAMDAVKTQNADFLDSALAGFKVLDESLLDVNVNVPVSYLGYKEIPLPGKEWSIVLAISQKDKIYAVEADIKRREKRKMRKCCLIIWHDGDRKFTLRLTGLASGFALIPLFGRLNKAETRAKIESGITDKLVLSTGWDGHDDMGGSPRYKRMSPFIGIEEVEKESTEEMSEQAKRILSLRTQSKNGNGNGHSNGNGNGHATRPPADPKVR